MRSFHFLDRKLSARKGGDPGPTFVGHLHALRASDTEQTGSLFKTGVRDYDLLTGISSTQNAVRICLKQIQLFNSSNN